MDTWQLIVGLGNPGDRYSATRHNAGFMVLERLADRWGGRWSDEKKFGARIVRVDVGGRRVLLCQPQTFMNLCGEAVGPLARFYKIALDQLLVIVDDVNLPFGELRLRPGGGNGGHHGLESIELHMAGNGFARQRIGIGRPAHGGGKLTGHVLGAFEESEADAVGEMLASAANQAESWLSEGVQKAMNNFNGSVIPPTEQNEETEEKE
ncbi:MAG: aminoacyl-tRNA hydrolase [Verrucomicrobiota bacterium]|jgi:PTH1 family peptidyl-tRNA hydrolase|nr:aminoacyl-tRNA hydrolase [Verrucomicrobiota bacterium]|tara:strand:- start:615 stop:1238 length:624 start_codon:yes stop_codon:yes gene_type:complete